MKCLTPLTCMHAVHLWQSTCANSMPLYVSIGSCIAFSQGLHVRVLKWKRSNWGNDWRELNSDRWDSGFMCRRMHVPARLAKYFHYKWSFEVLGSYNSSRKVSCHWLTKLYVQQTKPHRSFPSLRKWNLLVSCRHSFVCSGGWVIVNPFTPKFKKV